MSRDTDLPILEQPPPDVVRRIREIAERPLGRDEFERRIGRSISDREHQDMWDLIEWFQRRFPTVRERLAHGRRMSLRLKRAMPPSR
jgi:hypothetical protein